MGSRTQEGAGGPGGRRRRVAAVVLGSGRRCLDLTLAARRRNYAECTAQRQDEEADAVRTIAIPITIENIATRSAKNEVLSAVDSAVSVTQGFRSRSRPAARSSVLRGEVLVAGLLAVGGQEAPHLRIALAAGRLERMMLHHVGERLGLSAVLIAWPAEDRRS